MNQPITVAAVDDNGQVVPIEGQNIVTPAAAPWVLLPAGHRRGSGPNTLRTLGIVVTGTWAPDFGTSCSSPVTTPIAFRLTMGGERRDLPNQWRTGPDPNLGACRTAFSVGQAERPDQLNLVPD
jgi:hypothetical protein